MSECVERLKWLCSPDAERLGDFERINQFVKAGLDVLEERDNLIEQIALRQPTVLERDMQEIMRINNGLKAENELLLSAVRLASR